MEEYKGELVRNRGGFGLNAHNGRQYALELPRVPVDLFGKNVVITGEADDRNGLDVIVAHHIREQE